MATQIEVRISVLLLLNASATGGFSDWLLPNHFMSVGRSEIAFGGRKGAVLEIEGDGQSFLGVGVAIDSRIYIILIS